MKTDFTNIEKARKLLNEYHQLELATKHFDRYALDITVQFDSLLFRDRNAGTTCSFPLDESEYDYIKEYILRRMKKIEKILEDL